MEGKLVKTLTSDGLWLHGFLVEPQQKSKSAILHVHGHEGNFYENDFLPIIAQLAKEKSIAFLTGNNRGSGRDMDFWNADYSGYHRIGAERESFTDCMKDIGGWLSFLRRLGYTRFILEGHSYGGPKVAYTQWKEPDAGVCGLIFIAATPLKKATPSFFDFSKPENLRSVFSTINLPSLWIYGGGKDAFIDDPKTLFQVASTISGANTRFLNKSGEHFIGYYNEFRQILNDWIDTLSIRRN